MKPSSSASSQPGENKDISWENNYGSCRCCLAIGQHTDIFGKAELEMLIENLNIYLESDPRLPHFICRTCITSLNDIQTFRCKVLAAEKELLQVISGGEQTRSQHVIMGFDRVVKPFQIADPLEIELVKLDVKTERDSIERDYLSEDTRSAGDEAGLGGKVVKEEDIDPDTVNALPKYIPISASFVPEKGIEQKKKLKRKKFAAESLDAKKKPIAPSEYINIGGKTEIATDNTKIRANIVSILQNSTVFPFRSKKANCFKCFYCEKTCGLFKDLKDHANIAHKNGPSDYTVFKWLQARNKKIIHADISDVICRLCHQNVSNIDELVKHLIGIHRMVIYDDITSDGAKVPTYGVIGFKLDKDSLQCHLCQTEFRFLRYLISHMIEHYGCFTCSKCDKKFVTSERLNEHCKTHEQTETQCTDCHLVFNTRRTMLDHRYLKHIKKKRNVIKCTDCPLTFPTSRPILRFEHMEKEHGIKRPVYKCELCSKTYQTIHGMNHHTRSVHIRKNEFMCDICGYVTTEKTVMSRHLDHHNGVRKFECDYCHKMFRTKGTLRLHLRGHFNDKRFACSLCDAAFIQKHCLKSHVKSRHPDSGIDVTLL